MASAYFGILAWLGPRFSLSGWICIVLIAGSSMALVTSLIGSYANAVGKAGALARYGIVSMVVNIVLTVPMVLLGSLGVVAATAIGQWSPPSICCTTSAVLCGATFRTLFVMCRCSEGRQRRRSPWPRGRHPALPAYRRGGAVSGWRPGAPRPRGVRRGARTRQAVRIIARPRSAVPELRHWANLAEEPLAPASGPASTNPSTPMCKFRAYRKSRRRDRRCRQSPTSATGARTPEQISNALGPRRPGGWVTSSPRG